MRRQLSVLVLGVCFAAGAVGCGQQGPLVLPEARPIERVESPTEPEQDDDERTRER